MDVPTLEPSSANLITTLFGSNERTRSTSRKYNEPMYRFLDTSAWRSVDRVRQFWEGWFSQYDEDKKPALAARFQSYDNHNLLSAFLELFTFAVLKHAGYAVQIEPPVGTRTLDFLASSEDGQAFYVECTATGRRAVKAGTDAREADVIDAIDKVPTGRFILQVNFTGRGAQSAPLRQLRGSLTAWLSSFDRGEPYQSHEWTWRKHGWVVQVTAIPTELEVQEDEGAVGIIGPRTLSNDQPLRLRTAIDGKASKYGSLDRPMLVVTNSTEYQTERDLMTALLGDVVWHINFTDNTYSVGAKPNGIFSDTKGPRNVALSAVTHSHFDILNFADKPMILVHHPFASHPLPLGLGPFYEERHFDPETGKLATASPTMSVGNFFGLATGWPFFDQDPR